MEHKSWLWKKKSTEKTMITADKINRGNDDEANLADKAELQRNLKITNEKLSAALAEINAKDDIAKKQTNIAREAIQGWEKAEAEVLAVKQELEKATQHKVTDEGRLRDADAALKECMLQLRFVREEQEKRIHDAVRNTSTEHEKTITILEEKLADSHKKLSKISSENTQLSKTLSSKERIIDELHSIRAQIDYDLTAVMSRLESTQRENASLSYEVRVLEKELEIRNEERDFNRRTAEVAHKQYLESVKKIAKLETEAQRLRMLVRKRLPGPASLAKMKNVAEDLARDQTEVARRRSNPFPIASNGFILDNTSGKQISFLTEQLCAIEEENRLLKEFLNQKTNEFSKIQTIGPSRSLVTSREFSIAASSDMGSDEKVSMAESWAPSCNTVGASDIGLMDDFVEMEKLALVSVDKPFASLNLVQENHPHWIDDILKVVSEHARLTQRSSNDMLDDIKVALVHKNGENFPKKTLDNDRSDKVLGRSDMKGSIKRLIELIEGIRLTEKDDSLTGFTVHIFQWKISELRVIIETFLQSCTDLLNGKVYVVDFAKELTSALEWIVNHCFSLQDVSSVNDEIKKQFEWDEIRSESEIEGTNVGNLKFPKDDVANLESKEKESEIDTLEGQTEVDMVVENVDESKSGADEELDAANRDEHVLSERPMEDYTKDRDVDEHEITIRSAQEITSASEKLAECQETILHLGKQLKTLASSSSPQNTRLSDTNEITVSPLPDKPLGKQLKTLASSSSPQNTRLSDAGEVTVSPLPDKPLGKQLKTLASSSSSSPQNTRLSDASEITVSPLPDKPLGEQLKTLASSSSSSPQSTRLSDASEINVSPLPDKPLGKQLKALATSPQNPRLSNTSEITVSPLPENPTTPRISLLDKMMFEDAKGAPRSPNTKVGSPALNHVKSPQMFVSVNGVKNQEDEEALVNYLSIVPKKKKSGGGMLKRWFWRRKKNNK